MTTISRLRQDLQPSRAEWAQIALVLAWMLTMIALPILKWTWGESIIPAAVTLALGFQFAAVMALVINAWGKRRAFITFVIVSVTTWSMEFLGSSTGFPFGEYDYTDVLQPQLAHVPLLIPIAWFMMLAPSWTIAQTTVGRQHRVAYVAVSALAITAWDFFLDPQMVLWGFWVWDAPGAYFGIPLVNYAGWLLTASLATALVRPFRRTLPVWPLLTIYGIVWFLQSVGLAVFWRQIGPAIFGCIGMGSLLLWATIRTQKVSTSHGA